MQLSCTSPTSRSVLPQCRLLADASCQAGASAEAFVAWARQAPALTSRQADGSSRPSPLTRPASPVRTGAAQHTGAAPSSDPSGWDTAQLHSFLAAAMLDYSYRVKREPS